MSAGPDYKGRTKMGPKPVLKKLGVISPKLGEMTPFVYKNHLCYIKTNWKGKDDAGNVLVNGFVFDETDRIKHAEFGEGCRFMSGYCEDDRVYGIGTIDNKIYFHVSEDLDHWSSYLALEMPEKFMLFNTSLCKGAYEDGSPRYILAVECARAYDAWSEDLDPDIGAPFTEFFAESSDLVHWNVLPYETAYAKDRYVACPVIRYVDGFYYMICLEQLPLFRFAPYIYRTQDFLNWEIGIHNPVLMFDEDDRKPAEGYSFTPEEMEYITTYVNINDCDVDLCEFEGKTYVYYMTGNQLGGGVDCKAVYDGPMSEFLKAWFV